MNGAHLTKTWVLSVSVALMLPGPPAQAASHLWHFNEVFTNADGTVQFIELKECCGSSGEVNLATKFVKSDVTGKTYNFTANLTGSTSNRYLLLATAGFAALPGAPTPDYIMSNNFLGMNGDTLHYWLYTDPGSTMTYGSGALPTDGTHSLRLDGTTGVNSPTNYAGQTGSVTAPSPCSVDADCDDHLFCTADLCIFNTCNNVPDPLQFCDDGVFCNGPEACNATNTGCVLGTPPPPGSPCGEPIPSDPQCDNPDTCDGAGTCQANNKPGPCDDGDPDTVGDTCVGGYCVGTRCGNGVIDGGEQCDPNAMPTGCDPPSICYPADRPSECTCGPPVNDIVWGPTRSCTGGPLSDNACTADADCHVCVGGPDAGDPCTNPGQCTSETCSLGASCATWPNNSPLATTRSLVFSVTGPATPQKVDAIRVCMVDLQHPVPPNAVQFPPQNFSAYEKATCAAAGEQNGCCRWVGPWVTVYESQGPPLAGPSIAARLQCTPYYSDWKSKGPITVVGAEIMPSSQYSVQAYGESCMGNEGTCASVSAAATMYTRRSADVNASYNPPTSVPQPDGIDMAQVVNKFNGVVGAPVKGRAQLQPNVPELNTDINAMDIVAAIDTIKGKAYPFAGPCPCPSLTTCGSLAPPAGTPCASPGVCIALPAASGGGPGAMCVKTCVGGINDGQPCLGPAHCPGVGAVCGNGGATPGFCRDKCGRCNQP